MMNTTNRLFRYFGLNLTEEKTIRQISIETKIPYMSINRAIKELEKEGLITIKNQGKAKVCSLNKGNTLTKQHLILASEPFKTKFIEKQPLIKGITKTIAAIAKENIAAILFGSYARGTEQKHSDIDIAFISNTKKTIEKIKTELNTTEQIHNIEINIMIFTENQFKEMLTAKEENVGKQILKNHVVLHNPELFWNLIYEAMQ